MADASPEHETAQSFARLTSNADVENRGYEAGMMAPLPQLYEGSEIGLGAGLGIRERLPPGLFSTILSHRRSRRLCR
jgi:hypothetical protein